MLFFFFLFFSFVVVVVESFEMGEEGDRGGEGGEGRGSGRVEGGVGYSKKSSVLFPISYKLTWLSAT